MSDRETALRAALLWALDEIEWLARQDGGLSTLKGQYRDARALLAEPAGGAPPPPKPAPTRIPGPGRLGG